MPQGQLKGKSSSNPASTRRKAAPKVHKKSGSAVEKQDHKVSAAISRRIETLMAGRLIHEGGKLAIIPKPENVDSYVNSGARMDKKAVADLMKSSIARRVRKSRDEGKEKEKEKMKEIKENGNNGNGNGKGNGKGEMNGLKRKRGSQGGNGRKNNGENEQYNELGIKIAEGNEEDLFNYKSEEEEEEEKGNKKQKKAGSEEEEDQEEAEKGGAIGSWFNK
jgi:hypothetical protein